MTGNLNSQNVYPVAGSTYNCGSVYNPFQAVVSNNLYATGSDGSHYVQLRTTLLGTTTTQGTADIWAGNDIAKGTAGNAKGRVIICNANNVHGIIVDNDAATVNRTFTLPKVAGQLPVVSVSGTTLNITY